MKNYIFYFLLLLFLSLHSSTTISAQNYKPTFSLTKKTTHKIKKDQTYSFGYLKVPENRQNPNSKMIELPVYIFKSRGKNPKPDPIIYTVGGPGSTTMPSAQYMNYYQYLDDRDFILIEQRGNYYAKPHLVCPEWEEAVYQSNLPDFDPAKTDALFKKAVQTCRDRLVKKGIDLNGYNTNEIAADINDLVKILEIEQYNLLTISYSTKIAQVLMRDYPERIRSVVMDSPLPLEVQYDEESVQNLLEKLGKLLDDCLADPACAMAYPNIKERFLTYLTAKTKSPLKVTVEHPTTQQPATFYLKGRDLITVFTSASTNELMNVPFEINKLLKGDLTSVKLYLSKLFQQPSKGDGRGMRLSVWCAEETPFNNQEIITNETTKYPEVIGLSPSTIDEQICNIWNVQKVADIENQAVISDLPVLLISGGYDYLTPAKWAEAMTKNLSNSHHIIFPTWGHTLTTNWGDNCAMQAANDFFNQPNQLPKPICLENKIKPIFKIE